MRRKFIIKKIRTQFECQRCQLCCRAPGYVFLNGADVRRIAPFLKMNEPEFLEKHTTANGDHRVLKSREDGACIFLDEKGCRIHEVKPAQCRDFPHRWRDYDAYDYCEGIKKLSGKSA